MIETEYKYRLRDKEATWGIAIGLLVKVTELDSIEGNKVNVVFSPNIFLTGDEKDYLIKGFESIYKFEAISKNYKFEVEKVEFNDCDFQKEGLYFAVIQWASKHFGLKTPKYNHSFNKLDNKYVFDDLDKPDPSSR